MKLTKKEHIAFILGVILIGGFFGTIIFFYLPEFWKPAAVWSIKNAVIASVLLFLPIVFSYPFTSKKRIWLFFSLLLLAGYFVKDLQIYIGHTGNSLLESIQLSNSWVYLNYFLVPIVLTVLSHWACGFFSLSLLRFVSNLKNNLPPTFNVTFFSSTLAFLLLSFFTIGCMLVIKSGPIYVTASFLPSTRVEIRDSEVEKLKGNWLSKDNISEIEIYVAHTDIEHEFAQTVFQNIMLLEIEPESFSWRGKYRTSLLTSLKGYNNPMMELSIIENSERPEISLKPSYSIPEATFVLNKNAKPRLSEIGISMSEWSNAVATKLRLSGYSSIQSLGASNIIVNDMMLNLRYFGAFEIDNKEFQTKDFPIPNWVSLSSIWETSPIGVSILLDESKVLAYNLNLSNIEAIILEHLDVQTTEVEISSFEDLLLMEDKRGKILLKDISLVQHTRINIPQGKVNGKPYEIKILEDY